MSDLNQWWENAMQPYAVVDNVLVVNAQDLKDYDPAFEEAIETLLSQPKTALHIDLRRVKYLSSVYIGLIAAAFFSANEKKCSLHVKGQHRTISLLRAAGLDGWVQLETAEDLPDEAKPRKRKDD